MKVVGFAIIILTLVVGSQCATNCHWGPSYWCQDEVTAEECGQTQHCKDNVWKDVLPESGTCDLCKAVIEIVQQYMNDTITEEAIDGIIDRLCDNLWPYRLQLVCNATMNKIVKAIYLSFKDGVDNPNICEQLCNSTNTYLKDDEIHPLFKQQPQSAANGACSEVAETIRNYADNEAMGGLAGAVENMCNVLPNGLQSMEAIVKDLSGVCDELPSTTLRASCKAFVNRNTSANSISSGKTGKSDDRFCFLCKTTMINMKYGIIRGATMTISIMSQFTLITCRFVPFFKSQCKEWTRKISQMVKEIVRNVLESVIDPDTICKMLDECTTSSRAIGAIPLV